MENNTGNKYDDILELARQLGNIRYELIQKIQQEFVYENEFNKTDQTFLHGIEFDDTLSDEDLLKLIKSEKANRKVRRDVKNRKQLIQALLDGIIIKSPAKFVDAVITAGEPFDKNIERLKKFDTLWVIKEEE